MKVEKIKCDYCKEKVPEQMDEYPTWFGRYKGDKRVEVICKECLPENREEWRSGGRSQ